MEKELNGLQRHEAASATVSIDERADLLSRFTAALEKPTYDGQAKRRRGEKPPWYNDDTHEAAMFRHIGRWKSGDKIDNDSGAHALVHVAWRALALALRETGDVPANAMPFGQSDNDEARAKAMAGLRFGCDEIKTAIRQLESCPRTGYALPDGHTK